ncbi:MAG: hypothetical protein N3G78_06285 [Desulfobacterota bacterium]|nr:hypothetical protein [Thermodesulfobacteriota bacterium]
MVNLNSLFSSLESGYLLLTGSIFLLIVAMVVYFRKILALLRPAGTAGRNPEGLAQWVQESERLYEELSKVLEERKKIAEGLIAQLDERIEALRAMKIDLDRYDRPIAEEVSPKESEEEVLKMAQEGKDYSEIAKETGLSVGAIQFIMNLRRYEEASPFKSP